MYIVRKTDFFLKRLSDDFLLLEIFKHHFVQSSYNLQHALSRWYRCLRSLLFWSHYLVPSPIYIMHLWSNEENIRNFCSGSTIHNNVLVNFAGIAFKLEKVSRKNAFLSYKSKTLKSVTWPVGPVLKFRDIPDCYTQVFL